MKPVKTWILVADGAAARIFLNEGPSKGLKQVSQHGSGRARMKPGEINADRPGRTFDSAGQGRHAMEPPTDPQRHAKLEFAKHLAGVVKSSLDAHEFDRLIVVASPVTLGDLRKAFDKTVTARLHAEVDKDLTHADIKTLAKQLSEVLAV